MVKRFLDVYFGGSVIVGSNVKVGFHERHREQYYNKSYELTGDLDSTISDIKKILHYHQLQKYMWRR